MGKTALFAIAAFTVMGAIYGMSTTSGVLGTTQAVAEHDYEILARNAAVSGYEAVKLRLTETFAPTTLSGSYEGATYSVSATSAGANLIKVTSVGLAFLPEGGTKNFTVVATIQQETTFSDEEEVPQFMQYALITEEDLTLGGNLTIDTLRMVGMDDAQYNANVHTNGKLTTNGKAADIRGFGTYKTTDGVKHKSVFRPYYNPAGDPVVRRIAEGIDIPAVDFDIDEMATKMTPHRTDYGSVTLSGTYDFSALGATRDNPYVWRINGNVKGAGNVKLNGYVILLVDGNAEFNGNMQQIGPKPDKTENQTAVYLSGDLKITGTADFLYAQFFVKNDVAIHGTAGIYGNIVSGGTATISGTPTIKYYPASPALTKVWQDPETYLKLISYREY